MTTPTCSCCNDSRKAADISGHLRPCSRCDVEGFERWLKERSPEAPAMIATELGSQKP